MTLQRWKAHNCLARAGRGPLYPKLAAALLVFFTIIPAFALGPEKQIPISLQPTDVLPTGNEWISLPDIRADNGALTTFNVLSMRDRGLLQAAGENGQPVAQPYFEENGNPLPFLNPSWDLIEYWIPKAHLTIDHLDATVTWCAPPGFRAAFAHLTLTNHQSGAVTITLGVNASWGALDRVTYNPVALRGQLISSTAPWVSSAEVFSYITDDTHFAWSLMYPGSQTETQAPPATLAPELDAHRTVTLQPGQTAQADFILGAGVEEFSAAHAAESLAETLNREGADAVIAEAADWCRKRTRTTGEPDLDLLMNRNFLFTALYAWGRTIDAEQFIGVTSRSPRYYVSAAYWDRDAMLWSFPALLDIDKARARNALEYALTIQLRDTGTYSRFIDGIVLEDGFELDEAVAPLIALTEYVDQTGDEAFLSEHRDALSFLRDRVLSHYDANTGLYSSLQDAQDEYQKLPFITYDNALVWKAFLDLASLYNRLHDSADAQSITQRAADLHKAIMAHMVVPGAPGADGPIFVDATDGAHSVFAEVPPGSLMKLPALGFISEDDPVFAHTYRWLHSANYQYSYSDQPYGLPGSYRLPFTTSWSVADHLMLKQGRDQAMKVLRASRWDGGIITEGINPQTAVVDSAGRAFATAAGYMAHSICKAACKPVDGAIAGAASTAHRMNQAGE